MYQRFYFIKFVPSRGIRYSNIHAELFFQCHAMQLNIPGKEILVVKTVTFNLIFNATFHHFNVYHYIHTTFVDCKISTYFIVHIEVKYIPPFRFENEHRKLQYEQIRSFK